MKKIIILLSLAAFATAAAAKEYHVSPNGSDNNNGTATAPLKTINAGARLAGPGDTISVYTGTYREWVDPQRGGTRDDLRITYRAYPGEKPIIKGSEIVTGWIKDKKNPGVWKITIPNSFFGNYNPFKDIIFGDWFWSHGWEHHTGEVFLNGKSLYETDSLHKVANPLAVKSIVDPEGSTYKWYVESDDQNTHIWANFHGYDPNKELIELAVRPTCFYPTQQGINYITLDGFEICQAATQWGAPTAGQVGMVATHWNKGWIIENNRIHDSKCSGITLGKEHGTGHNVWTHDQAKDGSLHYIEVTMNVLRYGWDKANIGSHIVRNNEIYNCEQTGICGSHGAAFSKITGNYIHNIHTKRQFSGAEIGGIKFHAAIDTEISDNCIHTCGRALWLDWMTQGTRVSSNLLFDNDWQDIFIEVSHGPYLVDNNIMLSPETLLLQSDGGAFVHNIIGGRINANKEFSRFTPYHLPHSTQIKGLAMVFAGDDRYYNNIFIAQADSIAQNRPAFMVLAKYSTFGFPLYTQGNVYTKGTARFKDETAVESQLDPSPKIIKKDGEISLEITLDNSISSAATQIINTAGLGEGKVTGQRFENPDGTPLAIDSDYFDKPRVANPTPGPFENPGTGRVKMVLWKR